MAGYACELFYSKINDKLLCTICKNVFIKPQTIKQDFNDNCKHIFCKKCLLDEFAEKNHFRCPLDKTLITKNSIVNLQDETILAFYYDLEMKFKYPCEKKICIEDYEWHISNCSKNPKKRFSCYGRFASMI